LFIGKPTKTAATRAALFDSNMHQIVCLLALRPRPHWGTLQRFPRSLAVFRGPTSKGRGRKRRGGDGKREQGRGERMKGKGKGEGREDREFVLCPRKEKEKSAPTDH